MLRERIPRAAARPVSLPRSRPGVVAAEPARQSLRRGPGESVLSRLGAHVVANGCSGGGIVPDWRRRIRADRARTAPQMPKAAIDSMASDATADRSPSAGCAMPPAASKADCWRSPPCSWWGRRLRSACRLVQRERLPAIVSERTGAPALVRDQCAQFPPVEQQPGRHLGLEASQCDDIRRRDWQPMLEVKLLLRGHD